MKLGSLFSLLLLFSSASAYALTPCGDVLTDSHQPKRIVKSLKGLSFDFVFSDSAKNLEDALYSYPRLNVPKPVNVKNGPSYLPITDIHFMQQNCRHKSQSHNGGYSVLQNAMDLNSGKLKVTDLPVINVWKDTTGKVWTINHRRLAAYVLSKVVKEVPVQWISKSEAQRSSNKDKYYPLNDGRSIDIIFIKKGIGIQITNE